MQLKEDIRSVTDMKLRPAALLGSVNKHRRPVVITQNGHARAVLQDIASYEATRKALGLLKLMAQGEQDIKRGRTSPQSDVFARLKKRLQSLG